MTKRIASLAVALLAASAFVGVHAGGQAPSGAAAPAAIDKIFSRWTASSPGCAVGASARGGPRLATAYGMADLERSVPNTAATIFEAGSVSKPFTAAAVLLLARDGKLSLEDPVRKFVPEVPEYEAPITIRQMLTHTSGLRDWGLSPQCRRRGSGAEHRAGSRLGSAVHPPAVRHGVVLA
jgi:CubicO group peptidase (beta-lactamase class C family)